MITRCGAHISLALIISGCGKPSATPKIIFCFENGFQGVFHIMKPHDEDARSLETLTVHVPADGVTTVENFSIFLNWHQESVGCDSASDGFTLYNLGSDEKKIIYFYGDEKTYQTKIRFTSPTELKAGALSESTPNRNR